MYQVHEVLGPLHERHVHDLNPYQQHLVAAICVGWTAATIAEGLGVSPKSLYRHVHELAAHVLDPTGVEATREFLRSWAELQADCCTAEAFRLIKEDRIFEKMSQTG